MIAGLVEPGFGGVADALTANLERRGDVGAACCVYVDGRPVVDIWAGIADVAGHRPWAEDTLVLVFSTTKGATAICANLLIERGLISPDTLVADVWPEFGANGKDDIPLRAVLSHRAGLPVVEGDFTLESALAWFPVVDQPRRRRRARDWHEPTPGYHVRSYGWITGEIVRRVTGRTIGRFFADEVARPLGLDWWIGLPEALEPRVSRRCCHRRRRMIPRSASSSRRSPRPARWRATRWPDRRTCSITTRCGTHARCTLPELPSSNGITSARGVARLYAATVGEVDGHRVLAAETVAARDPDRVRWPRPCHRDPGAVRPRLLARSGIPPACVDRTCSVIPVRGAHSGSRTRTRASASVT